MLHIIYLQLQVQARARKFYAADCSLVLRSRCIARRLICTQAASSTHRYAPGPARSTRPRCTSPPLRRARPGLHPGLQHPPGLCRDDRRHAAASLSRDEDCSGRQREARTVGERLGRLVDERRRPKRQRPRLLAPPTAMDGMQNKIFFKNLDRINFRLI